MDLSAWNASFSDLVYDRVNGYSVLGAAGTTICALHLLSIPNLTHSIGRMLEQPECPGKPEGESGENLRQIDEFTVEGAGDSYAGMTVPSNDAGLALHEADLDMTGHAL
jgi:hypothetical protein